MRVIIAESKNPDLIISVLEHLNIPKRYLGIEEAAEFLNCKPQTVRCYCHSGLLEHKKVKNRLRVSFDSLSVYKKTKSSRGRKSSVGNPCVNPYGF